MFKFLKKNYLIDTSPFELINAPKTPSHLPDVLSPEDVEQLLNFKPCDALEIRDLAIVELMYSSGLRVSETANINLDDFESGSSGVKGYDLPSYSRQDNPTRDGLRDDQLVDMPSVTSKK